MPNTTQLTQTSISRPNFSNILLSKLLQMVQITVVRLVFDQPLVVCSIRHTRSLKCRLALPCAHAQQNRISRYVVPSWLNKMKNTPSPSSRNSWRLQKRVPRGSYIHCRGIEDVSLFIQTSRMKRETSSTIRVRFQRLSTWIAITWMSDEWNSPQRWFEDSSF